MLYPATCVILCLSGVVCTKAQNPQPNNTNEAWIATTEFLGTPVDPSWGTNMNPSRTTESHVTFSNRRVDTQHIEILGPDRDYERFSDIEAETIDVNPTTTRKIVRGYTWDGNGKRSLMQLTEETTERLASGDTHLVRTTSNSDLNGKLNVVRREITDTKNTSPNTQEVQTTVYVWDGNGGFIPYLQTRELQNSGADHTVELKTTTLQPDSDGHWKISEVKEGTIKEEGTTQTSDEQLSRVDLNGKLSQESHTVREQIKNVTREESKTLETYPVYLRRVSTIEQNNSGEKTTEHGAFDVIFVETRKTSQASPSVKP